MGHKVEKSEVSNSTIRRHTDNIRYVIGRLEIANNMIKSKIG